jgi:hypothetical protein
VAIRLDLQAAAQLSQPLSHTSNPNSWSSRRSDFIKLVACYPVSFILHLQVDLIPGAGEANLGDGTARMPVNICEALLDGTKNGCFEFLGEATEILGHLQSDLNRASLRKSLHVPSERRCKPRFIQ